MFLNFASPQQQTRPKIGRVSNEFNPFTTYPVKFLYSVMLPVRLVLCNLRRLNYFKRSCSVSRAARFGSTVVGHRPFTNAWAVRPYSTLPWTEIQPYNAVRVRLKDEENWDSNDFTTALKSWYI